MKRFIVPALIACTLILGGIAAAEDAPAKKAAKPMKAANAHYLIMAAHTPEECMKSLDEFDSDKALSKFDFGCESGDHTAYAIVSAANADAAKMMLPEDQRANAKVVELHKFTSAELKAIHQKMMEKK